MRILRQNHFPDALLVFSLWSQGTGEARDRVELWLGRARDAGIPLPWLEPEEKVEAPVPSPEPAAVEVEEKPAKAARGPRQEAAPKESLPPEEERRPPPGPADFLPF